MPVASFPLVVTAKLSPDIVECPLGVKLPPIEYHGTNVKYFVGLYYIGP